MFLTLANVRVRQRVRQRVRRLLRARGAIHQRRARHQAAAAPVLPVHGRVPTRAPNLTARGPRAQRGGRRSITSQSGCVLRPRLRAH